MNVPFDEKRLLRRADPLDARTRHEFDWSALDAILDEPPEDEEARRQAFEIAAEAIHRLIVWLTSNRTTPRRNLDRTLGRRAIAMIWVLRPDLFEGTPSLAKLAKRLRITRASLSWHTANFSRVFGLRNRAQASSTTQPARTSCEPRP